MDKFFSYLLHLDKNRNNHYLCVNLQTSTHAFKSVKFKELGGVINFFLNRPVVYLNKYNQFIELEGIFIISNNT